MSQSASERELLDLIVADPDDLAARLVYADWASERGDPRGEFIQVQCALAELDEFDARRPALEAREAQLLRKYRAQWARPFKTLSMGVEFRRGFIEHAAVKVENLAGVAEDLFRLAPLRSLKLGGDRGALGQLVDCEALLRVRSLGVSSMRLGAEYAPALFACPHLINLVELDVGHNGLGVGGLRALVECPYLRKVESLNLDDNRLRDEGMALLADSGLLGRLVELSLQSSQVHSAGVRLLAASGRLGRLKRLSLHRSAAQDEGLSALAMAAGFRPRDLDLSLAQASTRGVLAMAEGGTLVDVERLDLHWSSLGDDGARGLASAKLPRLRDLNVSRSKLSDAGGAALFGADWMPQLRRLQVASNELGVAAMRALAQSGTLSELRELGLHGNELDERALAELEKTPGKSALRRIQFGKSPFGDSDAALERLKGTGRFPELESES